MAVSLGTGASFEGIVREVVGDGAEDEDGAGLDGSELGAYVGPVWVGDGSRVGALSVGLPALPGGRELHAGSVVPCGHFGGSVVLVAGGGVLIAGGGVVLVAGGGVLVGVLVGTHLPVFG